MDNQVEQSAKAIINSNDFIKMFIKKYFLYTFIFSFFVGGSGLISVAISLFSTYFIFSWAADDIHKKYIIASEEMELAKKKMIISVLIVKVVIACLSVLCIYLFQWVFGIAVGSLFFTTVYLFKEMYIVKIICSLLTYIVIAKLYSDMFDDLFKGTNKKPFVKFVIEMIIISILSILLNYIVLNVFK